MTTTHIPDETQPIVQITRTAPILAPPTGLSSAEAEARRARGMGNGPPPPTGRTYWAIISENAFNFINLTLFALGLALILLGRWGDALVSNGIILINILVSVIQEIRAKRMLDRIALLNAPAAHVLRDGQERELPPEQLVIGDVLLLRAGDQVIVDGRVVGSGRAMLDESQLSGESNLIPKQAGDPVYSGSFCVSGSISYEAELVGAQSFANRLIAGARVFRRILTPMQREIYLVIRITMLIVVYLEFLNAFNALLKQQDLVSAVQNSTMIAGLVPNGLFLSISIAYALAAVRIARFGALVQQSNAIESLSNVDTLCLDKTGTLTTNRLQLHALHPTGGTTEAALRDALAAMTASSTNGNNTSAAIAVACPGDPTPLLAEVPFASDRKWSAVAFAPAEHGPQGILALGAPEMLHPFLAADTDWQAIAAITGMLAEQGLRVLLVAHHPEAARLVDQGSASRLPDGMQVLGLVSLSDELRPEERQTLQAFERAGVQLKLFRAIIPKRWRHSPARPACRPVCGWSPGRNWSY